MEGHVPPEGGSITVTQLTRYIRALLESDELLGDVRVRGEVGRVSQPTSGHLYFDLKDAGSQIRCVVWRSTLRRLTFLPETGVAVVVRGRISLYEPRGEYQLVVEEIHAAGVGALYEALEQLRQRLAAEGLFDAARKRPLPPCPRRVALVTSPTGAALRDLLTVLRQTPFPPEIVIVPSLVQGEGAPASLAASLAAANALGGIDLVIVGRGGGSFEDLWPFNDERVVRAIAGSRRPVISAVGHEIDVTLADLVADMRAPTPTAAAQIVCRLREQAAAAIADRRQRMARAIRDRLHPFRLRLQRVHDSRPFRWPLEMVERRRQRLEELGEHLVRVQRERIAAHRQRLLLAQRQLTALAPSEVLRRGYARVERRLTGTPVTRAHQLEPGARVRIDFLDAGVAAEVEETLPPKRGV